MSEINETLSHLPVSEAEAFAESVDEFRSATELPADFALSLFSIMSRSVLANSAGLRRQIMDQFFRESDPTRFGLANAVTAVARDTRDPATRWRLEELGGAIFAHLQPPASTLIPGMKKSHRRTAVLS